MGCKSIDARHPERHTTSHTRLPRDCLGLSCITLKPFDPFEPSKVEFAACNDELELSWEAPRRECSGHSAATGPVPSRPSGLSLPFWCCSNRGVRDALTWELVKHSQADVTVVQREEPSKLVGGCVRTVWCCGYNEKLEYNAQVGNAEWVCCHHSS